MTIQTPACKQAFCAGADLKEIGKGKSIDSPKGGFAGLVRYPRSKPLIAAVDGPALAGGCEIVLGCDLIVASARSRFGVPGEQYIAVTLFVNMSSCTMFCCAIVLHMFSNVSFHPPSHDPFLYFFKRVEPSCFCWSLTLTHMAII